MIKFDKKLVSQKQGVLWSISNIQYEKSVINNNIDLLLKFTNYVLGRLNYFGQNEFFQ